MRFSRLVLVCSELLAVSGALIFLVVGAAAQMPLPAGPMHLTQQAPAAEAMQQPEEPQQTQQKTLHLLNESQVRLQSTSPLVALGAPQCDNNGALFVQLAPGGAQDPRSIPVYKISPAGASGPKFSLGSAPGFELSVTARAHLFSVSNDGGVYFLAQKDAADGRKALYVIHFAAWGQYLATVKMAQYFEPRGLAVLPGGGYFVLGMADDGWDTQQGQGAKAAANIATRPVGLFYGPKGKLLYEINLPGAAAPASANAKAAKALVVAGADGDVYVMRDKPAYSLYVIARGGASVNSVTMTPPFANAVVAGIAPAGPGKLAVQFARSAGATGAGSGEELIAVVNTGTGDRLVDYQALPGTKGRLGCYTQNGFELLAQQAAGGMAIRFVGGK